MYTSYIGKRFLNIYNEKCGTTYSAKEFFDEIFFDLFFNDEKHLLHVSNSPFFQKPREEDVKQHGTKALAQLNNLKQSIETDIPNMSVFVGAWAKDLAGTTSGQVTDMDFKIDENEMYASWIGQALAIGVSGGFVMLIDEPDILFNLFLGWKVYRKYLFQTPNVKDKQMETWNGQWIYHCYQPMFDEHDPQKGLNIETSEVQGNIAIPTNAWVKIVFALSTKFPRKVITAYCFTLSQTNTTIGFIKIYLPEVRRMFELRDKIFLKEDETVLTDKEIDQLSTFFNFKSACQMGAIGLKALEPAKLREYMPKGSIIYAQGKEFKFSNTEAFLNYKIYKIWITAMLNKTELLNLATAIAVALIDLESADERGKKVFATLSQNVRDSKNLKNFIESLTEAVESYPANADIFKNVVEQVIKMPADNLPLFITLIRFEYAVNKINK